MYQSVIKRIFDIIFSLLGLFVVLIILIPVAVSIKIEDGGKIFYTSTRLGKNMKEFKMYKFRSMKKNAPDIRNTDGTTYNSENDERVTKVGKIIRKTSIDELPQILNVLKGDMSLVGPRPSPLGDKSIYPKDFFEKFKVNPGITGYSLSKVSNIDTMEKIINL